MRLFYAAAFCLITLGSWAQKPYFLMKAPEKPLPGVKRVAILDFGEENNNYYYDRYDGRGKRTTDAILQLFMNEKRGIAAVASGLFKTSEGETFQKGASTAIFSFVERSEIQRILNEQKLSMSGLIDDSQATQVGKILGIDAIISGTTNWNENIEYGSTSRKKTIKAMISYKVISVTTGEILATFSKENTQASSSMYNKENGTWSTMKATNLLVDDAFNILVKQAADYIAPIFEAREFKFRKIKVKEFSDMSKKAMDMMDQEDFEGAMTIYKGIVEKDPYTAEALANIAGIYCIHGNYPKAVEYYSMAAEIDREEYKEEMEYAQKRADELAVLTSIGVVITMNELQGNTASALAKKVRTKGGKSDRYDVLNQPDAKSTVATKVPGDTEFEVISDNGDFFKIKLLGGKEGFIAKDQVKQ